MIITCNNCNKKFDIDSILIPDKGRLLQCASCNHKWFFKKEVLEKKINPINEDTSIDNVNIFDQNDSSVDDKESVLDAPNNEVEIEVDLEEENKEKIEINIDERPQENTKPKKQKNFKILNIFVVTIISFVAFIIIVENYQHTIS